MSLHVWGLLRLLAVTASHSWFLWHSYSYLACVVQMEAFSLLSGYSEDVVEYWNTC